MVFVKDDRLLLQFALHELFKSHEFLKLQPSKERHLLLFGNKALAPLSHKEGSFNRLYRYFEGLSFRDTTFQKLKAQLSKCLHFQEIDEKESQILIRKLKKVGQFLLDRTLAFYDENLLHFLLRNKMALDHLLAKDVIQEMSLISKEIDEIKIWLKERFESRGFHELASDLILHFKDKH